MKLGRLSHHSTSHLVLEKVVNFWDIDTESVISRPLGEEESSDEEVTSTTSQEVDPKHQNKEFRKQVARLRQQIMMLDNLARTEDETKFTGTGQQFKYQKSRSSASRKAELELIRSNLMKSLSSLRQENQKLKSQAMLAEEENHRLRQEKIELRKLRDNVCKFCEEKISKEELLKLRIDSNGKDVLFKSNGNDIVFNDRMLIG